MRQLRANTLPSQSFKARARIEILAEVQRSPLCQPDIFSARSFSNLGLLLRPAGMMILIMALVLSGGSIATVAAAKSSLPGDILYPVKIGLERAQINLAFSEQKQTELEMNFANSRLEEVNKIIAQADSEAKATTKANITQAMDHFASSLNSVQDKLKNAPVEVSKLVSQKTTALEDNLLQIKVNVATDKEIEKALVKVSETNTKSLATMVEQAVVSKNNDIKKEATTALQTKIERIEKSMKDAKGVLSGSMASSTMATNQAIEETKNKPNAAKKSIDDAKKILETNDSAKLPDVLVKIEESSALVKEAQENIKLELKK